MNFKNRLEALKWMCENPGSKTYFDFEGENRYICFTERGHITTLGADFGKAFFSAKASNFRTTFEYIPDLEPELIFPWLETCSFIYDNDLARAKQLGNYHSALIQFLDNRYKK